MINPVQAVTAVLPPHPATSAPAHLVPVPRPRAVNTYTRTVALSVTAGALLTAALVAIGAVVIPQGRRRHWRPGRATPAPAAVSPPLRAPEADSGADRTPRRTPPPPTASPPPGPTPRPSHTRAHSRPAGAARDVLPPITYGGLPTEPDRTEATPPPALTEFPANVPSHAVPGQLPLTEPLVSRNHFPLPHHLLQQASPPPTSRLPPGPARPPHPSLLRSRSRLRLPRRHARLAHGTGDAANNAPGAGPAGVAAGVRGETAGLGPVPTLAPPDLAPAGGLGSSGEGGLDKQRVGAAGC